MVDKPFSHRALRAGRPAASAPASTTRCATHRTRNSPPSHASDKRDVVSSCDRSPVSASRLIETAVRVDSWKAPAKACGRGRVFVLFMGAILPASSRPIHVQKMEIRT